MSPTGCVGMSTVATAMTMTVMMMYQAAFADSAVKHSSHTAQHIPFSHSKHKLPVTITGQTGSSCPGPCPKGFLQDKQKVLVWVPVPKYSFRTNKKSLSGSLSQRIPSGQTKSPCPGPCPKGFLQDKQKVLVWVLVPKDSSGTNSKSFFWVLVLVSRALVNNTLDNNSSGNYFRCVPTVRPTNDHASHLLH